MKKLTFYLVTMLQPLFLAVLGAAILLFLLGFKLGGITPGVSQAEIDYHAYSRELSNIGSEVVYAPHALAQNGLAQISSTHRGVFRLASVGFGVLSVVSVFALLRLWHNPRLAVLGTALYATSSWFLHTARVATPDILFTLIPVLLLIWMWLLKSRRRELWLIMAVVASGILLYIPGMVWFVLAGIIWRVKRIAEELRSVSAPYIIGSVVLGLIMVLPIAWAIYQNTSAVYTFLGLPQTFPAVTDVLRNIAVVPARLFVQGPAEPAMWLGRLPLLDLFSAVFMILGVYAYGLRLKLDRARLLFAGSALSILLFSLEGPVTIAILLPFVYIFIAGGLAFMLKQWFGVFPRNPFARGVGASLLTIAVFISIFYHINHYFIAWPNTPETRQVYSQQL